MTLSVADALIAIRVASLVMGAIWIVALLRIHRRAVRGRSSGMIVAGAFLCLAAAAFALSFLVEPP